MLYPYSSPQEGYWSQLTGFPNQLDKVVGVAKHTAKPEVRWEDGEVLFELV